MILVIGMLVVCCEMLVGVVGEGGMIMCVLVELG